MGRMQWGRSISALVLGAAVAAGVSGCGGSGEDAEKDAKPAAAAKTTRPATDLDTAVETFQEAVTDHDILGGCPSTEPNTCYEQMLKLMEPARELRKAMNATTSVSADFWTDAYRLIDLMEEGVAVGEDRGGAAQGQDVEIAALGTNRDEVFGSAHDLSDWLDAHPIQ